MGHRLDGARSLEGRQTDHSSVFHFSTWIKRGKVPLLLTTGPYSDLNDQDVYSTTIVVKRHRKGPGCETLPKSVFFPCVFFELSMLPPSVVRQLCRHRKTRGQHLIRPTSVVILSGEIREETVEIKSLLHFFSLAQIDC